jgi:hypothetical protein
MRKIFLFIIGTLIIPMLAYGTTIVPGGGAASTGDHGALTGTSDDDHTQYGHLTQNENISGTGATKFWEFQDDVFLRFGSDADISCEYDTDSDRFECSATDRSAGYSDMFFDMLDSNGDSTFTLENSDGTYEANLSVKGEVTAKKYLSEDTTENYVQVTDTTGNLVTCAEAIDGAMVVDISLAPPSLLVCDKDKSGGADFNEVVTEGKTHDFDIITSGAMTGALGIISASATTSLTLAQCFGYVVIVTAAVEIELDEAACDSASGANVLIYVRDASEKVEIAVEGAEDTIVYPGLSLGADDELDSDASADVGDFVGLACLESGKWYVIGSRGTWVDGGPADD